jgi:hypothetical protein
MPFIILLEIERTSQNSGFTCFSSLLRISNILRIAKIVIKKVLYQFF